jgi:hypothetical protein
LQPTYIIAIAAIDIPIVADELRLEIGVHGSESL